MADISYVKHLLLKPLKDAADIAELVRAVPNLLGHINRLELELWETKKELEDVLDGALLGPLDYSYHLESDMRVLR